MVCLSIKLLSFLPQEKYCVQLMRKCTFHAILTYNVSNCRCNKKVSCSIPADNTIFGDPCVSSSKYLEVDYLCLKQCKYIFYMLGSVK